MNSSVQASTKINQIHMAIKVQEAPQKQQLRKIAIHFIQLEINISMVELIQEILTGDSKTRNQKEMNMAILFYQIDF